MCIHLWSWSGIIWKNSPGWLRNNQSILHSTVKTAGNNGRILKNRRVWYSANPLFLYTKQWKLYGSFHLPNYNTTNWKCNSIILEDIVKNGIFLWGQKSGQPFFFKIHLSTCRIFKIIRQIFGQILSLKTILFSFSGLNQRFHSWFD